MGITWREELAVGDERIDNQHKELLERFDKLLGACRGGEGKQELSRLLGFLDEYVVQHFGDEEELQKAHRYPEFESHRMQHVSFVKRIADLKQEIAAEGEIQIDHVLATNKILLDWLVQHISSSDKALGKYLRSQAA